MTINLVFYFSIILQNSFSPAGTHDRSSLTVHRINELHAKFQIVGGKMSETYDLVDATMKVIQ
jgi:hypothetical protein